MSECPFYRIEKVRIDRSREVTGSHNREPDQIASVPWCSHPKHSPVPFQKTKGMGGGHLLKCGGDIENCPLSHDQYSDVSTDDQEDSSWTTRFQPDE